MVQVDNSKIILRLRFKKVGVLKYISHLDLVRTMNKIIVRANLPLYYSEGFNPKPKMVFAAPLSIGAESVCEYMDLRLTEKIDPELAKSRLNANMTENMQITEAYYPETKLTDLKWLSYTILIKTEGASKELADKCDAILSSDVIEVEKSAKSGNKTVNISHLIRSASVVLDGEIIRINCTLSADQSEFLNPEYVIKALRTGASVLSADDITKEYYTVMRDGAYTEDMAQFR
ncbi:MAG: DUF2344 domain-containing protein [Clostridia bacterium]|nr:DUF2344 domain-containing protein [Clostridia bacterium]